MGAKPHIKGGTGGKAPSLGCFCAYIGLGGCRGFSASAHFILPTQNPRLQLGGWKGFAQVFINIITPKARDVLIFWGKHRKNVVEIGYSL